MLVTPMVIDIFEVICHTTILILFFLVAYHFVPQCGLVFMEIFLPLPPKIAATILKSIHYIIYQSFYA